MIKSVLVFIINFATGKWERMFLFDTEKYKIKLPVSFYISRFFAEQPET